MPADEKELMEGTKIYVDCVIESLPVSPSYIENLKEQLKAESGVVRRNRQHLIPLHTPAQDNGSPFQQQPPEPVPTQAPMSPPQVSPTETPAITTRSGRAIIKPNRLNL
ncbi:uncharacterized protein LOC117817054 [Scomber scombrus]|uniref:Uncharacterized protein LOC117817054 n=1 Tax=Scomber scombrus TaxID=13677 RepID=A0AAV1PNE3_SCOSC